MSKVKELAGQKFAMLTVIERTKKINNGKAYWLCRCDCGRTTIVSGSNLRSGAVKSCGCLKLGQKNTHHLSHTRLFSIWWAMKERCKPQHHAHKYYSDKNIAVCDDWEHDFVKFYDWAISNGYQDNLTIDRIDSTKGYCPENCRFVDRKVQSNNRSTCRTIEYNGKKQNLMQWCEELNLNYKLIHSRMHRNHWSFERAISEPVKNHATKG